MIEIDFDFARYIAQRRGRQEERARTGSAYSFAGERKVRRTLNNVRPVAIAIEATTRLWKNVAKTELLGTSVQVTDQQFPRVFAAVRQASARLQMSPPPVYVSAGNESIRAQALGTNDDAYIVVNAQLVENLGDVELIAVIGHELGHIQNNQVVYATALYYLTNAAVMFVRWVVQPAIMTLQAWSRRAEITCDRAALICTQDLDATLAALVKSALGLEKGTALDIAAYLEHLPDVKRGVGRYAELFRSHPYLPKRVQALRVFAESAFYQHITGTTTEGGLSADEVDAKVSEILSVF